MIYNNKANSQSTIWLWMMLVLVLLLATGCSQNNRTVPTPTSTRMPEALLAPQTWKGITPGVTHADEALKILGVPDRIENQKYVYENHEEWGGWKLIELWIRESEHDNRPVVRAIYRDLSDILPCTADVCSLQDLVLTYGRPDRVTWSCYCQARYAIWSRQGVASTVGANPIRPNWDEAEVAGLLFFEPMALDEFLTQNRQWPYPSFACGAISHNMCKGNDAPDTLPEDPYDWEYMPTPPPEIK